MSAPISDPSTSLHLFPVEIWSEIATWLSPATYRALSQSCHHLHALLRQPHVKKEWMVRYFDMDRSDALVFAYRHNMVDVVDALLASAVGLRGGMAQSPLVVFKDAFAQIVCHEAGLLDANAQKRKLHIIRELLDGDRLFRSRQAACLQAQDLRSLHSIDSEPVRTLNDALNDTEYEDHELDTQEKSTEQLARFALRWCCHYGEHECVRYLLEDYSLRARNLRCSCAWWLRILREKRFELVELLLRHGASIAVEVGHGTDVVEWIDALESTTTSAAVDEDGERAAQLYPLRAMTQEGHLDAVQVLLRHYAPVGCMTEFAIDARLSVLLAASMFNRVDIVRSLLCEQQIDLRDHDVEMQSLRIAAGHGHAELVSILLQATNSKCATSATGTPITHLSTTNAYMATSNTTRTPNLFTTERIYFNTGDVAHWYPPLTTFTESVAIAAQQGHLHTLEHLLDYADETRRHIDLDTLLLTICNRPHADRRLEILQLLLDHHADIRHRDFECFSAALRNGNRRTLMLLLDHCERMKVEAKNGGDEARMVLDAFQIHRQRILEKAESLWKLTIPGGAAKPLPWRKW
jgi:hypothetical protein